MFSDSMHEECGVFGIFNHPDAAQVTYLGLYALQHRGQESSGMVVSNTEKLTRYTGMGLVNQVFCDPEIFQQLQGPHVIGHNRYSTTGSSSLINAQPVLVAFKNGQLANSHNGNLINAKKLRRQMEKEGSIFTTTTDTEVIMHLVARSKKKRLENMLLDALFRIRGAYSILFLTKDALFAARDPYGVRPLLLGKLNRSYVISSETCAFDLIKADTVKEIKPGEMLRITDKGIKSFTIPQEKEVKDYKHCIFEHIYFSRPDSFVFGENVDKVRRKLGRKLAREHPAPNADCVISVPDSANTAALGYAEGSGLKYEIGLIRNHYVGRTFIHPEQEERDVGARIKFNTVKGVLKDKNIVIVDDSLIRGTTMKKIVELLRSVEPKQIHLRISSPPVKHPCFYGIDMPSKEEFIANKKNIDQIRKYLKVDSLGYLSVDGMLDCIEIPKEHFCIACFTGDYPIDH
ncbi:MAG: amidophosphoribosyltransferase [bacterium]